MSNLYKRFGTLPNAERDGVWVDYGDGVQLKLRRAAAGNPAFREAFDRRTVKNKRRLDLNLAPPEEYRAVMAKVYADAVVVDWKGVQGPDGELAFSAENVEKVLYDLPEFFAAVQRDAMAPDLFRDNSDEADAKN